MTIIEACFLAMTLLGSLALLAHVLRKPDRSAVGVPMDTVSQILAVLKDSQRLAVMRQQATMDPIVGRMLAGGYAQAMPEAVPPVWHGTPGAQDVGGPQDQLELQAIREDPTTDIHGNPLKYESVGEV